MAISELSSTLNAKILNKNINKPCSIITLNDEVSHLFFSSSTPRQGIIKKNDMVV